MASEPNWEFWYPSDHDDLYDATIDGYDPTTLDNKSSPDPSDDTSWLIASVLVIFGSITLFTAIVVSLQRMNSHG